MKNMIAPPFRACAERDNAGHPRLIVQNYAQEAAVDGQRTAAGVIDKAKLPELIHEMTDPRSRGANHLGQVFLIVAGKDISRIPTSTAFLAPASGARSMTQCCGSGISI